MRPSPVQDNLNRIEESEFPQQSEDSIKELGADIIASTSCLGQIKQVPVQDQVSDENSLVVLGQPVSDQQTWIGRLGGAPAAPSQTSQKTQATPDSTPDKETNNIMAVLRDSETTLRDIKTVITHIQPKT